MIVDDRRPVTRVFQILRGELGKRLPCLVFVFANHHDDVWFGGEGRAGEQERE